MYQPTQSRAFLSGMLVADNLGVPVMTDFTVNLGKNNASFKVENNGTNNNSVRDQNLRLERTMNKTLIPLEDFVYVDGKIENAPKGTGKESVEKKRTDFFAFVKDLGIGLKEGVKSLYQGAKAYFRELGERRDAAASFKELVKDVSAEKPISKNEIGRMFALATQSKDEKLVEKALGFAIARGMTDINSQPNQQNEPVTFNIVLAGLQNKDGDIEQMSDGDFELLKNVAIKLEQKQEGLGKVYLQQIIDIPSMTSVINDSFDKHVEEDKAAEYLRNKTAFTNELGMKYKEGVKVDTPGILKDVFSSPENKDFMAGVKGLTDLIGRYEKLDKEIKQGESKDQSTLEGMQKDYDEAVLKLKARPNTKEFAEAVVRMAGQMMNILFGDTPKSIKNNVSDGFVDFLRNFGEKIADKENLGKLTREDRIDGLYQNAFILRGVVPSMIADPKQLVSLAPHEKKIAMMIGNVIQLAANGTLFEERKSTEALMNAATNLPDLYNQLFAQLKNAFGAPVVE
ncbi:MAG: hypothetical protein O9248_01500 [Rhodobacteraceae bacterium]|nr:hypothetical protein [Paracoccaceae bacterium]